MIALQNLKLITFDVTGTLLQFRRPPFQVYLDLGQKYGITGVDPEVLKASFKKQWKLMNVNHPHFGNCWKTWWTDFVVGTFKGTDQVAHIEDKILNNLATELIQHFTSDKCWEVKPGGEDLLKELKQYSNPKTSSPLGVGVISNFDPRVRDILKGLKLFQYFDFLTLSHEVQMSKPNPSVFASAFRQHFSGSGDKVQDLSKYCLHVGDNYELDYIGATSAGWKGVVITSEEQQLTSLPSQLNLPDNRIVFTSLQEFNEYLFGDRTRDL